MNKDNKQADKESINKYFSDLQFRLNLYEKYKNENDIYLASNFNIFDYINPNENKLSDIIADLLNPNGTHGQKEAFLREFINMTIGEQRLKLTCCKVKREASTSYIENNQRRIDITLNFDNKFEIGIENKPWDDEQENQLQDYEQHLNKKYGGNSYCIVYLSGDGSPPESLPETLRKRLLNEGKLFILNYEADLRAWLEKCYRQCEAEKLRFFIRDFISYIEENFENYSIDTGDVNNG